MPGFRLMWYHGNQAVAADIQTQKLRLIELPNLKDMEKKFKRNVNALADVFSFAEESCAALLIDASLIFSVNFVIEELFTNMLKYNKSGTNSDISISFEKRYNRLFIALTDYDVDAFDITEVSDVDTSQSLDDRKIGGLGVHLVKKMVDDIQYKYNNRQSTITLIKNLR